MSRLSVGLTIAILLSAASSALAVALRHRPETERWTEPAGSGGERYVDIVTTADYYALQVVTLWDHNHRICAVQLEQTSFATATESVLERVKVCEPRIAETWRRMDVGEGRFITALAACIGGSEGVLRGLELWGSELQPNGLAKAPRDSARFAFEDCAWSEPRACPWGHVATGLRVFTDGPESGIVGLALRCHRLEPR
jgi:hypothetical protein